MGSRETHRVPIARIMPLVGGLFFRPPLVVQGGGHGASVRIDGGPRRRRLRPVVPLACLDAANRPLGRILSRTPRDLLHLPRRHSGALHGNCWPSACRSLHRNDYDCRVSGRKTTNASFAAGTMVVHKRKHNHSDCINTGPCQLHLRPKKAKAKHLGVLFGPGGRSREPSGTTSRLSKARARKNRNRRLGRRLGNHKYRTIQHLTSSTCRLQLLTLSYARIPR